MAAEQIPGGRWCACGCGSSLEGFPRQQRRMPGCQAAHRKAYRNKRSHKPKGERRHARPSFLGDESPRPQKPCPVCAGMPWARTPERWREDDLEHLGDPVVGDNGLCAGCGDEYAPEPPPPRGEALVSSAGTAARHGALYGVDLRMKESRVQCANTNGNRQARR